jgi:hypothetical protein
MWLGWLDGSLAMTMMMMMMLGDQLSFYQLAGRQAGRQAAVRITQTADAMYHDTDVMIRFSGQLGEGKRRLIMEAKSTF